MSDNRLEMARTTYRHWPDTVFPDIDLKWFRNNGAPNAKRAFEEWKQWLNINSPTTNDARFRKALQLGAGVASATVGHFLSQYRDPHRNYADHVGEKTRSKLDRIASSLGWKPQPAAGRSGPQRRSCRVVLFVDFDNIANPRFHLNILGSVLRAAAAKNISVVVCPIQLSSRELGSTIQGAITRDNPHAIICFGFTPNKTVLDVIRRLSKPVILVHAARIPYTWPVVVHIVPVYDEVSQAVQWWARGLRTNSASGRIVIATMKPEQQSSRNLRVERIEKVKKGIEDAQLRPTVEYVADYTAAQAFQILEKYPEADGYVCFSDEMAVAIKQLRMISGKPFDDRILGFDGSEVARHNRIPSLSQHLDDLGTKVVRAVEATLDYAPRLGEHLRNFQEIGVPVKLTLNSGTEKPTDMHVSNEDENLGPTFQEPGSH